MAFKTLFIAKAPDANLRLHNSLIDTGKSRVHSYIVRSQEEALQVCRELHETEKIDSVILCPGFSHQDTADIFNSLNGEVAVTVARGDGPNNQITGPVLKREFYGD